MKAERVQAPATITIEMTEAEAQGIACLLGNSTQDAWEKYTNRGEALGVYQMYRAMRDVSGLTNVEVLDRTR